MRGGNDQKWGGSKVCTGKKCPRSRDSVCLARDTANFRFRTMGRNSGPNGPKLGPIDTVSRQNWSKHDKKATQILPKCVMSINGDSGTRHCPSHNCRAPLLLILGRLGGKRALRGRMMIVRGPKTHPGGYGTPMGSFRFLSVLGLPWAWWG